MPSPRKPHSLMTISTHMTIYSLALDVWAPYQCLTGITYKIKNCNHIVTCHFDAKDQRVQDVTK